MLDGTRLLDFVDAQLGGGPRQWCDFVVVRNVGPLLTRRARVGDLISNRGFNAIVLAPGGGPSRFIKVRSAGHLGFEREADITVRLATHPETAALVPPAVAFWDDRIRVLAEDCIEGPALDVQLRSGSRVPWQDLAAQAIRLATPLWRVLDEIVPARAAPSSRRAALTADLELLQSIGLSDGAARGLSRRLDVDALGARQQHGDFWPRNVICSGHRWRVIDFESCGEVSWPLYDAFHMVRGCAEASAAGRQHWLQRWISDPASRSLNQAFSALAEGMSPAQVETALCAYLVDFAARLHRRGISRERTAARLRELDTVAGLLDGGLVRRLLP
jgi:hypothetical protein